ncbi:MAG: type II secretion system F family protein [Piscinibacter sp.]
MNPVIKPQSALLVDAATPRAPAPHVRRIDEEQFAHDLALMLRSGLSLLEALRTLSEQGAGPAAAPLRQVLSALQRGESLSRAMQSSGAFGVPLLACAKASELTGDLADSLQRFAANAARIRALRSRLVSACVYPALLVGVTFLVVLFLLVYVVPRFALVLDNAAQDVAPLSRALIHLGRAMHEVQAPIWLGLAVALGALAVVLWRQARAGQLAGWVLQQTVRLPWMRPYVRSFGLSQLARSGAMLIRSGVPALKALAMCRELVAAGDRPRLDRALAAAATGEPLAQSLHEAQLLDTLAWRVLRVAEETGQLHTALDRVADVHDALLERGLERLGRLIEPMLMLAIGTVVGGIVVLMYVPIFQMASSIR